MIQYLTRPLDGAKFGGDDRAVSEIMGSILVFGLLLLLLVLAQVTLVPVWNQQVEYEHSLRAQDDVGDLQTGISRVAAAGNPERTAIETGVSYPSRPLLVNPPPVQGEISTTDRHDVGLYNVVAEGNGETRDFWDGLRAHTYGTRSIRYGAGYHEYENAGSFYIENGVMYRDFGDATVVTGSQNDLISGKRITLVVLDGEFGDASGATTTVGLSPVSAPSRSVAVTNASGENIEIAVRTRLSKERWNEILADERAPQGNVVDIGWPDYDPDATYNTMTLFLRQGVTYDLRMAKVGVGSRNVGDEAGKYLTADPTANRNVPTAGGDVVVAVRDRFNNPVSGTEVRFEVTGGNDTATFENPAAISDEDGHAVARLSTTGDGVVNVTASRDLDGDGNLEKWETVSFTTQVGRGTDGGASGTDPNPNLPEGNLVFQRATIEGTTSSTVTAVFRNTKPSGDIVVENLRINFIGANGPGSATGANVDIYADGLVVDGQSRTTSQLKGGGQLEPLSPKVTVASGDPSQFEFTFVNPGDNRDIFRDGDLIVVTMTFEDEDLEQATYFLRIESVNVNQGGGGGGGNQGDGN